MSILLSLACVVLAYALGSIPTGLLVAKLYGVNIRKMGSGNIGATNVLRSVGRAAAIIVVLADPIKAMLAVLIAMLLDMNSWIIALTALAAILGNIYNPFLGFNGGKGVATSLGVFMLINPAVAGIALATSIVCMILGRMVSLGALTGICIAPLLMLLDRDFRLPYLILSLIIVLLALRRHRANISKLRQGTERRIGEKAQEVSRA